MAQLSVVVMPLVDVLHMHGRYFYVPKSERSAGNAWKLYAAMGVFWPGLMEKWSRIEQRFSLSRILSSSGSSSNFV